MSTRSETYRGHEIVLRKRPNASEPANSAEQPPTAELLIDGEPIRYGRLPHGPYYLHENVYDWDQDLVELARRLIEHRAQLEARRRHDPTAGE